MDKLAAEKIAQEYYSMGVKLAFYESGIKVALPESYMQEVGMKPPAAVNPAPKSTPTPKPTPKPKRDFFKRYDNKDVMPNQQDKQNLIDFRDSVRRGIPNTRLGKMDVFRGSHPTVKHRMLAGNLNFGVGEDMLESQITDQLLDEYLKGPMVSRPDNSRPFINLPDNRLGNNKIVQAHEYYHANKPGGDQISNMSDRSGNEHMADLYAGLTDFDLKDVADYYLGIEELGSKQTDPTTHDHDTDPHLDDQTRLRLFAGMAR